MKIKTVNINDLNPAEYNPRIDLKKGDEIYEKLFKSIDKFGYVEPIIWNEKTGNVVGGHQRLKILIDRGCSEVEVSVVNLSIDDEKSLNLALNKITGDWDKEKLSALLEELNLADIDISVTGFNTTEIEKLLSEFRTDVVTEDDFDIESSVPDVPVTKKGDIWILGSHRLICGDSTKADTYKALLEGEKSSLVITDPPYNADYEGIAGKIQNDKMSDSKFYDFLLSSFENIYNNMIDGASIYIFHSEIESSNFINAFKDAGFHHSGTCVWVKQSFVMGRCDYQWQHEPILYGWKKGAPHNWYSDRSQSTIWSFDRPTKSLEHPTMKPIALCAYPITNSSLTGDIILDAFGGSGSTLIACEQTERICRIIEIDEKYCDVIVKRYQQFTGKEAELIRNGKK